MTDYTSEGAVPADDAAVDDPPTVDEVLEEQRRRDDLPDPSDDPHHQQVGPVAGTSTDAPSDEEDPDLQQMLVEEAVDEGRAGQRPPQAP